MSKSIVSRVVWGYGILILILILLLLLITTALLLYFGVRWASSEAPAARALREQERVLLACGRGLGQAGGPFFG